MSYVQNPSVSFTFLDGLLVIEDERHRRTVDLEALQLSEDVVRNAMADVDQAPAPLQDLVKALVEIGALLIAEDSPPPETRQSRSLGYLASKLRSPQAAQRHLSSTSVMILGVGGTGSVVLQHLIGAGVRDLVLVDHDTVELSNLNRQFIYTTEDVGISKLEPARTYVADRALNARVEIVERKVRSHADMKQLLTEHPYVSVVACCIDDPPNIEPQVVSAGLAAGLTVMTGAVGIEFGHVGPLFTAGSPHCLPCWYSTRRDPAPVPRWSHGVTNTLVGALMAQQIMEWAMGVPALPTERMTVDFTNLEVHRFRPSPTCDHA
ncbi:ThiF family adenylyltransferase [Frigoribacterium sp. CFBP9030]|uniref:ThiF family adenylyltransferase n=1 Tax=Frigoribacterium sp. CFBP9030 TaxID=3096537 RepID=UPI002A6A8503|nr:ThiF family adenylyltransferase [Frigoribacterium sp. CFBP9030]MDY0891665.1 ThiF family adenylyltransferase [Frigoribacterium sp. CFBP9030]